jgi:alpha-galactosidase
LLIGCDLSKLDAFTLNLLTNDEVIAIDQDPLGKQGRLITTKDSAQIWVKELEDGSKAVAIFNLTNDFKKTTVKWEDIGLKGSLNVRDVWKQKNLGLKKDEFGELVPPHGVVVVKVSR